MTWYDLSTEYEKCFFTTYNGMQHAACSMQVSNRQQEISFEYCHLHPNNTNTSGQRSQQVQIFAGHCAKIPGGRF